MLKVSIDCIFTNKFRILNDLQEKMFYTTSPAKHLYCLHVLLI